MSTMKKNNNREKQKGKCKKKSNHKKMNLLSKNHTVDIWKKERREERKSRRNKNKRYYMEMNRQLRAIKILISNLMSNYQLPV